MSAAALVFGASAWVLFDSSFSRCTKLRLTLGFPFWTMVLFGSGLLRRMCKEAFVFGNDGLKRPHLGLKKVDLRLGRGFEFSLHFALTL